MSFANKGQLQALYEHLGGLISVPQLVQQFQPGDIYTEDERMIGRWVDGKPLYQKVITGLNLSLDWSAGGGFVYTSTFSDPLIEVVDTVIESVLHIEDSTHTHTLESNAVFSRHGFGSPTAPVFILYTFLASGDTVTSAYLKYTKTIDTATSCTLSSPGNYSTQETIIGTWIDGSPVYQKTVAITEPHGTNVGHFDSTISNDYTIVDYRGICIEGNFVYFIPSPGLSSGTVSLLFEKNSNTGTYDIEESFNFNTNNPRYYTIQYIK